LALLALLPESPERDLQELKLIRQVGFMFNITRGYAAPETVEATERAAKLAEKSGDLTQLANVVFRRGFTAYVSGDLTTARTLADQALEIFLRRGSPIQLAHAHGLQLWICYWLGDLAGVERHFSTGLKFFNDPGSRISNGPFVPSFAYASWNAWILGRADVARQREAQMMAGVNSNDPYNVAYSQALASRLRLCKREYEQAESLAARALELSEKSKFPYPAALCRCVLGRARAQLRHMDKATALIRDGMDRLLKIGSRFGISSYMAYLAEAQEDEGALVEALETLEQALRANPNELVYRPEILRLRGELRLKQEQTELAEGDFRDSIALAQKIGAKAWELRATMSLARLLAKQGHCDEARVMLAEIYGWFTKGFDTADLKDAKALLDGLSA
jgi:tetratricopeptide (TPR) repeat protein